MPAPHPPATLVATDLGLALGGRTLLRGVSITAGPGDRLGVVGPNGVGKTTLLRVLAGLHSPDAGSVKLDPPRATVGYLAQEHDRPHAMTVRAHLHERTGSGEAEAELAASAGALGRGERGSEERYTLALERYESLSVGDLDARIDATLEDLGLDPAIGGQPLATLSGGQRSKVALAAIVLSRFDVLLLDEPTNDLDFEGLDDLDVFIERREGATVVVSHDRTFLDRHVTSVLELDEHEQSARLFGGGWSAYREERATARRHAEESYVLFEQRRRELRGRAQRERQWATVGTRREKRTPRDNDKAQRDFRINRTERLAARARQTERAVQRLEEVEKPFEGWELRFTIEEAGRSGAVVVRLEQAEIVRGSFRLGPLDLEIAWGERVALVGRNGTGKSSLVGAVLGRVPLAAGRRWIGPSVVVGELGQDRAGSPGDITVFEAFQSHCGLTAAAARSLLAKFGIGAEQATRRARSLSPGERTRVELATFQGRGVNFLVLDEPSNHLDLAAIEQVEEALSSYRGTLLVVSHDRQFLEAVEIERRIDLEPDPPASGVGTVPTGPPAAMAERREG